MCQFYVVITEKGYRDSLVYRCARTQYFLYNSTAKCLGKLRTPLKS